jgi:hypothetical protein
MDDLRRIRFATQHFHDLQGLRLVPFGVTAVMNIWLQRPPHWDVGVAGGLFLLSVLIAWMLGPYYRRRFGHVRARPMSGAQWLTGIGAITLFYVLQWQEVERGLPVSMLGLMLSSCAALFCLTAPRLRWHWGVAAAAFAVTSLLPVLGISTPQDLWGQYSRIGNTLFGVTVTICGIMDHRLLLGLVPEQPLESSEVALEHSV